ncbi:MAG: deoxynucleoside kinase [Anaerolineae bacterium]|nr:deoxynucleoside kinase [Anaerolineales bacterium]MCQ3975860.1 deoxynucleoside kinase [Anaerolineae bacterium]
MNRRYSIAIAGNMGVGKSTLTRLLAKDLSWTPFYEAVDDNPYLADFYKDMRQWSFHSQIFFLSRRLRYQRDIANYPESVVQDRSIYEDAEIFARNLHQRKNMTQRDYQVYRDLYEEFIQFLPRPDLIIYLKASLPTLIERIHRRGRDFEQDVSPLYLQQLNELYTAWIEDFTLCPILTVPADNLDFVRFPQDFTLIKEKIMEKLAGREKVYF